MIIVLVALRFLMLLLATCALLYVGKREHVQRGTGWHYIAIGFGIVTFGSFIQLGMYIPALHGLYLFSDVEANKIFAEIFGYYLGISFILGGLWRLGPALYSFYVSEDKLAESEHIFQTIVNTAHEGIVVIQDTKIVFANPSLERIFRAGPQELIGERAMDYIEKSDHKTVYERRDAILEQKDRKDVREYKLRCKDGTVRDALISSQYINWQGKDAFLSIVSDVTEFKQVQANLAAIANTASEAIAIFQDEHLVYCNPALISNSGFSFEELQSKPFSDFVHPDDRAMLYSKYEARQSGSPLPEKSDFRMKTKSGETIWVMISAGLTQWKGRVATVTILTDITDRKRAEEELHWANENLERRVEERTRELMEINEQLIAINNQKSAFVSSTSHEIRTPLASILGFSALVERFLNRNVLPLAEEHPALGEKVQVALNNLKIIKTDGDRLTRLLNDMLDVSKIEAGRMEWQDEVLLFQDVVQAAARSLQVKLDAKRGVGLKTEMADEPLRVLADSDRMIQVVTNLMDNAIKFTDEGEIQVSVKAVSENRMEFRVTDSGIGMTPQERGMVFQKYYQAESRSKGISKAPKGTGLGLAICKEIVEHYAGNIGVEPGPAGKGSSFYVRLPLSSE